MLRQATQKTPITALYARLSKDDEQQGESLSIENQKDMLTRYARERNYPNVSVPGEAIAGIINGI